MKTLEEFDNKFFTLGATGYHDVTASSFMRGEIVTEKLECSHLFRHYVKRQANRYVELGYVTVPLIGLDGYQGQVFTKPRIWHLDPRVEQIREVVS